MKTAKCADCNGKGKRTCSHCKGTNKIHTHVIATGEPVVTDHCAYCRGDLTEYCRTCHGAGMVEPAEPRLSIERWQIHTDWIKTIRTVVASQNRRNAPTKRLATAIEKAINNDAVSVYWHPDRFGFYEFVITMQGDRRWTADDNLTIFWSKGIGQERTIDEVQIMDHPSWSHLDEMLDCDDTSDYLERIAQEKTIAAQLDRFNGQIENLEAQIAALRDEANRNLTLLPIPPSAKTRTNPIHWDHPTIYARTMYPHIWPSKK